MIDPQDILYGHPFSEMTELDFANLAIACLDQAGCRRITQHNVKSAVFADMLGRGCDVDLDDDDNFARRKART